MKSATLVLVIATGALALWNVANTAPAGAQHDPAAHGQMDGDKRSSVAKAPRSANNPRGGILTQSGEHQFETVFAPDGIRVYLNSPGGHPEIFESASGVATLEFPGGQAVAIPLVPGAPGRSESATYFCPMHKNVVRAAPGVCDACGGMKLVVQNRLFGAVDLSKITPGTIAAQIQISGLDGPKSKTSYSMKTEAPKVSETETKSGHEHSSSGCQMARGGCGMASGH